MGNNIKLKPCPFCGGTNLYYAAGRFYAVECGDCGGKVVGAFITEKDAAEAWNTRSKLKESDLPPQSTDAADVRDNGKPLGYWDDTGRCNRSRRNAQKIGSHRRRAILKLRTHKEIISSYEYRNR